MTQKKILFGPQFTHTFALLTRLFGQPEHHHLPAEQPNSAANFRLLMFTLNQNALIRRRHLGIQVQKPQLLLLRKEERQVLNIFGCHGINGLIAAFKRHKKKFHLQLL